MLKKDENDARQALSDALAAIREPFEPETTARNLRIIRAARERRRESSLPVWAKQIEDRLDSAASTMM